MSRSKRLCWSLTRPGVSWATKGGYSASHVRLIYPPIRVVHFSKAAFEFGIQTHSVAGGKVRVYSPAKTVADCFKFRSKIGMETAIQVLRSCFREKKTSIENLWRAAKVCRVANVMRPYMESLV